MSYRTDGEVTAFKAEIKKRVLRHLGDEVKTDLTDFIDDYMKDALRAIARAHTWTWRRLAPKELLAAAAPHADHVTKTDIPSYVDQYAEFMLYQEVDEDSLPLTYIPPAEWVRRDTQKLTPVATIYAFTVMDDDFYYSPPVDKDTGKAIMLFAHIAPSQLDDHAGDSITGIWKRVPDSFMYCLETGTLSEMDLLEENIVHKWVEKYGKELERLIGLDETSSAEGGK